MDSNENHPDRADSATIDAIPADAMPIKSIGKFNLKRPLGSGGMGTVYLAEDRESGRTVALKLLPQESAANPALVKRFQAEAEAAAQLKHENIVSVYEAGNANGYLFISLEYISGTDVQKLLKQRGKLPLRRTLEIVKQVVRALDHAFQRGIVHRDIKPSNLLIKRNGTVKLADMGLARSVDEETDAGLTRVGTTVGTVDYMAPEQARDSKAADIRSDIYSLGCAWYHMLVGQPPFPTGTLTNKLYAHISNPRPDPREVNPQVPASFVRLLHKMMARNPNERHATPADLLVDLERISFPENAASSRFLSALTDAVGDDSDVPTAELVGRDRRRSPRGRRQRHADVAMPLEYQEFLRVFAIVLGGLVGMTAIWWLVVSMIPSDLG